MSTPVWQIGEPDGLAGEKQVEDELSSGTVC